MENSAKNGTYRWIVFKKGTEWIGAALEFNIVEVGDDPQVVYYEMQEAAKGYIEAAQKIKGFRDKAVNPILNQNPHEEYEALWNQANVSTSKKSSMPEKVFSFGTQNLVFA